jgi:hypothetical protein
MFLLMLVIEWERRVRNPDGGTTTYTYSHKITWIVGALVLAWLTWFLLSRYLRARALRRRPRNINHKLLRRVIKVKSELSSRYLRPGFSGRIHAVGIGLLRSSEYCIQVFINDVNEEMWAGAGAATLPPSYRGVPVVLIEMPMAGFLSDPNPAPLIEPDHYSHGIRHQQEIIIGGLSGANTNLTGQSGTIGYFCTRRTKLPRRKEIYLLSNSHVFADLRKTTVDDSDLIMQPSPGEAGGNRPIGMLVNFSTLKFDAGLNEPNHVDAAIAKLWEPQRHSPVIPLIGAVRGYVEKKDINLGEAVRKFGRTTGYTEGTVFSIYLDIWIRYDRTGQSAFFQNQILIEPALPQFTKFVSKGDSGSLVVDAAQHAIGLVFGGMSEATTATPPVPSLTATAGIDPASEKLKRVESYGVANPISEVMDRLKIELVIEPAS